MINRVSICNLLEARHGNQETGACAQFKWTEGGDVVALWKTLPGLILHQHLWVRKLTADLFGLAFLNTSICKPFALGSWEKTCAESLKTCLSRPGGPRSPPKVF